MTEHESQPKTHHINCECGYSESFASKAVAEALHGEHDAECFQSPRLDHEEDHGDE